MRDRWFVRAVGSEWVKLRTVPGTAWSLLAAFAVTVGVGVLVCSAVDTGGGSPDCLVGMPGCGDEDVVLNSLSGAYLGQIAVVVLGVGAAASEHATGTIRSTFLAIPRRRSTVLAKALVVAAVALVVGVSAAAVSFLVGQPILHGNGFVMANGYPAVSLTDPQVARAVLGTGLYLALVAVLSVGLATLLRRAGVTVAMLLGLLYLPMMLALALPPEPRGTLERLAPMTAGLSIQRTIERFDSVPISPWSGIGITAIWAATALLLGAWATGRRDA